ncbi:MAG: discoidin domain-containing protein [Phycisphaerae bacterium]|nr:discoidin domain-containing protein [Phycisphaerae bacterium]
MCKKLMCAIVFIMMLCFTVSITHADLIAYWPLDEGTGDVAHDAVNGNDGQITGGTWVTPGKMGAAAYEGSGGDEINCGPGPAPLTQDLTLAWWMIDNHPEYGTIMDKSVTGSGYGYNMLVRGPGEDSPLRFRIGGWQSYGGWGEECRLPQGAYSDGQWVHIVCTYDSLTDTASIYVNGELLENGDYNPKTGIAGAGGYCDGINNLDADLFLRGGEESFNGVLDEVAIWDQALTPDEVLAVFTLGPLALDPTKANNPNPADEAVDVPRDTVLDWTPGIYAQTHNVYVGTTWEDVNSATTNSQNVQMSLGQTENSYEPGPLAFDQTYYWRVDEVNAAPDNTVRKGTLWSFTVEPFSIMIPLDAGKATASTSAGKNTPDMTVNGSGLEGSTHSEDSDTMWLSAQGDMEPWLMYEFDQVQKLDHMLIWNSNTKSELFIGWGIKEVNIEYSLDGVDWTALPESSEISKAPGNATYSDPQMVDLGLALAKYVRLNIVSNWGGLLPQYGVSEVQFYGLPVYARTANPASGSVNVRPDAVATWRAGREAAQHTIYASTDEQAVADGSAPSVSSMTNSVDLSSFDVQMGNTVYWKVDEVNEAEVQSVWAGPVWSLSTATFVAVDDFESYGNRSPNRPFQTWLDGFGYSADEFFPVTYPGNGTGAGIGHDIWSPGSPYFDGSIMETASTIPGSRQSMPFYYANTGGVASETQRTFTVPQNWTVGGAVTLSIPFLGQTDNTGTLYIKINGVKVTYPDAAADIASGTWQTWKIDLASVNTDIQNITKLAIGVEGSGAAGMLLIDDIRLYPKASDGGGPLTGSVPNGDFEGVFKPGWTTITADLGGGWTQGVGPEAIMDDGVALFSDGTSGDSVDIPGWIGTAGWEGSYDRDTAFPNRQGSVQASGVDGSYAFLANGGAWGNPNGGLIESADSLGDVENGSYTLTMVSNGGATPVVLELLAGGVVITPSSSVDPPLTDDFQEFSRTYEAASLASFLGQPLTIRLGVGRNAEGTQTRFDNVTLSFEAGQ